MWCNSTEARVGRRSPRTACANLPWRECPGRRKPPAGDDQRRSSGCLLRQAAAAAESRKSGYATERRSRDFTLPRMCCAFTSVTPWQMLTRRRSRSTFRTRTAVASPHAGGCRPVAERDLRISPWAKRVDLPMRQEYLVRNGLLLDAESSRRILHHPILFDHLIEYSSEEVACPGHGGMREPLSEVVQPGLYIPLSDPPDGVVAPLWFDVHAPAALNRALRELGAVRLKPRSSELANRDSCISRADVGAWQIRHLDGVELIQGLGLPAEAAVKAACPVGLCVPNLVELAA